MGDVSGVDDRTARRLSELAERSRSAFLGYEPAPLAGEVILLQARDPTPGMPVLGEGHGWRELVPQLSCLTVPGDHFTLLSPDHTPGLAETIISIVNSRLAYEDI